MKDVDGSAFKFCSDVPNDDEDDDEEHEDDEGESNGDVFNLEKIEMIEKVRLIFDKLLIRFFGFGSS